MKSYFFVELIVKASKATIKWCRGEGLRSGCIEGEDIIEGMEGEELGHIVTGRVREFSFFTDA